MKNFLKKYLSEEALQALEASYLADHPGSKELPIMVSKSRLDEVIAQRDNFKAQAQTAVTDLDTFKQQQENAIAEALKKAKQEYDSALEVLKKDNQCTEAIYKVRGKNVKAIKALIDPKADLSAELARLQKDEPYLFDSGSGLPNGTGRTDPNDDGKAKEAREEAQMRKAIGI